MNEISNWSTSNVFILTSNPLPLVAVFISNRAAGFEKYHHSVTYRGKNIHKVIKYVKAYNSSSWHAFATRILHTSFPVEVALYGFSYDVQLKAIRSYIQILKTQNIAFVSWISQIR